MIINNAGVVRGASFLDLAEVDIEKTISVNLFGQIWVTKCFLPHMVEKNHGHIVHSLYSIMITG